jgi:cytochrome b6-f complex iron-sulfur subunit
MPDPPQPSGFTRRGLVDWVIRLCGGVTIAALVGPALAYLWPITKSGPVKKRQEVGDSASWDIWTAKKVAVANKPVLVIRTDKGFVAFSAVCTHLGCLVEFAPATKEIHCPCHAGLFDLEGQVTGGPAPRPLPRCQVSEAQGKVYVSA